MSSAKEPQIPAAKLAEYVVAKTTAQRTAIIRTCIDPPEYLFRYGEALQAIGRSLVAGNGRPLDRLISSLQEQQVKNEQQAQRLADAIKCAKAAHDLIASPLIASLQTVRPISLNKPFVIEGLRVVVAPQCLLLKRLSDGSSLLGGLKCYTSKSRPLSEPAASFLGVLLHWYVEAFHTAHVVDPAICLVPDVFQQRIYRALKAFAQRRQQLMHASQEIHDRWDTVSARFRRKPPDEKDISTAPF
jgi:hypothetical protein